MNRKTVLLVLLLLFNENVRGQFGQLDTDFDGDGKVSTDIGLSSDHIEEIAVQDDGKIVAAGYSNDSGNPDFCLARYNPDGSLDSTFGLYGKVLTDFNGAIDVIYGIAIQSDGKIVAVGYSVGNIDSVALARYNADGSLDVTFGSDGKVTSSFGSGDYRGNGIAIQSDGKIVVTGSSENLFCVIRYHSDGSLDNSFDTDGIAIAEFFNYHGFGSRVCIQPDGKIVAAGWAGFSGVTDDLAVARFNVDGSLDQLFGFEGKVMTDIDGGSDQAKSVALQPDGKIVVGGFGNIGSVSDYVAARYKVDGSLDSTFSNDGIVTHDFAAGDDWGNAIFIQGNGKIVLAGTATLSGNKDFGVIRYESDGTPDGTFNGSGALTTDFGSIADRGNCAAAQSDGKILVGGSALLPSYDFAIARYTSGPTVGIVDFSVRNNDILVYPNPVCENTTIQYTLTASDKISIELTDLNGKFLHGFISNENQVAGAHEVELRFPEMLTAGSYLLKLKSDAGQMGVKISLVPVTR